MADSYFFDKRVLKRNAIKYLIIFLIMLPIFIGINYLLEGLTASWVIILIDVIIGVFLIIGLGFIYDKINNKRLEKKEQRIKEFRRRQKLEAYASELEKDEELENKEIEVKNKPQQKKKRKKRNRNKRIING